MPSKSLSKGKGKNKARGREIKDIPEHEWVPSTNAYNKLIFRSQPVVGISESDHGTPSASQSRHASPSKSARDRSTSIAVSGSPTKKQRFLSPERQILISDMDCLTMEESLMEPVADTSVIQKSSKSSNRSTLVCLIICLYHFAGYSY